MRRVGRVAVSSSSGVVERDSVTCNHCNAIVVIPRKGERGDLGGFCRLCMKSLCGKCAALGSCTPFEKKLEAEESRARLMRSVGGST